MDKVWDNEMDDAGNDRERTYRSGGGFNQPPKKKGWGCDLVLAAPVAVVVALVALLRRR